MQFKQIFCVILILALPLSALAIDKHFIVKLNSGHSPDDKRHLYNWAVLERALVVSSDKYGPYKIKITGSAIPNHQRLKALKQGVYLNVAMSLTNQEWEDNSTPIRIPIRRGIFSYRLIMTHKQNLDLFAGITNVEQLKKLSVGVRKSWTTRLVLDHLKFNIVDAYSYDALFRMLNKRRFDYVPRGINEIFKELEIRQEKLTHLAIEPNLALYIPSPYYLFVTPENPLLAERLEYGLLEMVKNGDLNRLFETHYGEYIKMAQLHKRRIIHIGNPILPEKTPFDRPEFWYDFNLGNL